MWKLSFVVIAIAFYASSHFVLSTPLGASDEYKLIETTHGVIRGKVAMTLFKQRKYYSFRGIPYARSPVGPLRFKAPQPAEPWTGVLDALDYGPKCLQKSAHNMSDHVVYGSENCLFMNVFVPAAATQEKLAANFVVHGGTHNTGSGNDRQLGPDFLVNEDVILVTSNYRLGIMGFQSFGLPEYSGNMALKDELLALKWFHANADAFGADRDRITIAGHSSGAIMAHLLSLAPATQPYFQRSIVMSMAMNPGIISPTTADLRDLNRLIHDHNQTAMNNNELATILQKMPGDILVNHTFVYLFSGQLEQPLQRRWSPTIESMNDIEPFLTQAPEHIYKNFTSTKEAMYGFTNAEFYSTAQDVMSIHKHLLEAFNQNFRIELPFENTLEFDSEEYQSIAKKIRNFYYGANGVIGNETLDEYMHMISDVILVYGVDKLVKMHAKKSDGKTFYYRLSLDSKLNQYKALFNVHRPGCLHADELCYIYRCHINLKLYDNVTEDTMEYRALHRVTKLWANFIKYGNPTPDGKPVEFLPIDNDHTHFLDIHNDDLIPGEDPHRENIHFWTELERQYRKLVRTGASSESKKRD